ncbi:uncharacterized protein LOC121271932 isoform X2 [Carcharodon carcharias]|uniref:uncharacterized protein LOC121271932 isoform X2 n=1 Tax=Carcharodon carcharias TaxID=13397 RepID=UPI001B7E29A6|nr:uncharacterized protein LOC121271932 isoform X2 [Carcharodon carcharias]
MALGALFVGISLLFQHVTGFTYLIARGSEDCTTLQCNVPTGAGNVGTLCEVSISNHQAKMNKTCNKKAKEMTYSGNIDPEKNNGQKKLQCVECKTNEGENKSLTFGVKPVRSMIFTCAFQDSTEKGSKCPSWKTLTEEGCENHDLFFVINLDDSNGTFLTDESSSSLTVTERENVTLPCQFELRKNLPFTLFWIISGNNKCLHSVHIESYAAHSNTRCCVDRESSQRISYQSSNKSTDKEQSHNLTIHSVKVMDTGRYLCVVHWAESEKPIWLIAANISLNVTSAESSDTLTSTSGISSVTSSGTPINSKKVTWNVTCISESSNTLGSTFGKSAVANSISPKNSLSSNNENNAKIIAIVCAVVLICIVGVVCIIRRKRQTAKGSSASGPRDGDVQLTQEDECLPYSVVPRREQTDENEHVAYAVTRVPKAMSQPKPGEGQKDANSISASTEHVYCLLEESTVKGVTSDGDKTEIQGVKCKDHMNHERQVETPSVIELNDLSPLNEKDPVALSNDPIYSSIGCPGAESIGDTVTLPHLEENDPKHCPIKMEENPIYSKMEGT